MSGPDAQRRTPVPGSRLPQVGTTIFTRMSALAARHGAINLSQGFPDFQPPEALLRGVEDALRAGHNQYAPMSGLPVLREAIAAKVRALYGATVDADREVTVTSGATEALMCAITCCVRPGDEVIVFDPAYDAYEPAVALAGGRTRHVPLRLPEFALDFDRLEAVLGPRTRLVIINSPHNPGGAVLSGEELDRLAVLLRPYDCFLLSDEVYEHIVFDGARHASVLGQPELAARAFAVSSFGKTYHCTGWKVGYCVAPAALSEELRKVHQYTVFCTSTPMQVALAAMLENEAQFAAGLADFYQARRDLFASALRRSRFELLPCAGTYFQLASYAAISSRTDTDFADWLTREVGVAAIPVSPFCAVPPERNLVRFCFAKDDATLVAAAERLCAI
jgi:methionine aminotransferase